MKKNLTITPFLPYVTLEQIQKAYRILFTCVSLYCATLLLTCCSKQAGGYECVVPRDASMVVKADMKSVADGLSLGKSGVMDAVKRTLAPVLRQSMQEQLDLLIDDPSLSGLDFDSPVYLFRVRGNMLGLVARVDDESLLSKLVGVMAGQGLCSKQTEHDGFSWCSILDEVEAAWSDNALLLLSEEGASRVQLQQTMLALMSQTADEAFLSTGNCTKMQEMEGEISMYANLAALPDDRLADIVNILPKEVRAVDIELVAGISLGSKAVDLNTLFYSHNESAQKYIDDYFALLRPAGEHFRGYVPDEDCKAWLAAGVNGPELLQVVKRIPALKEMLMAANLGIDLDTMIRTMQGDLLFVQTSRGYTLYSQVADNGFMDDVDYWMKSAKEYGIQLESIGACDYRLRGEGVEAYWGLIGDDLYMSSVSDVRKSPVETPLELSLDGCNLFAYINLSETPMLSSLTIRSEKSGELKLTLQMKTKLEELAQQLPRQWK